MGHTDDRDGGYLQVGGKTSICKEVRVCTWRYIMGWKLEMISYSFQWEEMGHHLEMMLVQEAMWSRCEMRIGCKIWVNCE